MTLQVVGISILAALAAIGMLTLIAIASVIHFGNSSLRSLRQW